MLDVSRLRPLMVVDACSVWNILSATALHRESTNAGCVFSITEFVLYECLYKPRKSRDAKTDELCDRLRRARDDGRFQSYGLSVDDLLEVDLLEQGKRLSKGELTTIAFARKTRQAVLTDDRKARMLASATLGDAAVQTTPQLLGWLAFNGRLVDSDVRAIVGEHEGFKRPLAKYFEEMHVEALRCRLAARQHAISSEPQPT